MSVKAMTWAMEQRTGDPTRKLLLLTLADHAGTNHVCWPSNSRLARACECGAETIRRHLRALQESGLIESQSRTRKNGAAASNLYRLMVPPQIEGGASLTGEGGNRTTRKILSTREESESVESSDYTREGDGWTDDDWQADDGVPQ